MMKYFNLFYITVIGLGLSLAVVLRPSTNVDLSFYGFAESEETEINYNYPVVVEKIQVTEGQAVKEGDVLLQLTRRKSKETMEDQSFRIAALKADESIWRQKKENQIAELELTKQNKLALMETKMKQLKKELDFKKSLAKNLQSISPASSEYQPLEEELKELDLEKTNFCKAHELKMTGLQQELQLGDNPYREQIKRLTAEQTFEAAQKVQPIVVTAPTDGLIGNIICKEGEHIPSYTTLMSFYEPHSSLIKAYVHEDLTLKVHPGDSYRISSLKDPTINYTGKVIGLGSRIVEIPTRLRKIPEIKSYGREVLIAISKENLFLIKEKVSLSSISL